MWPLSSILSANYPAPDAKRTGQGVLGHIAASVRRARLRLGKTQEEMAELAAMDLQFFRRVERGNIKLSVSSLVRIGTAIGVKMAVLLRPAKAIDRKVGRPRKKKR